MRQILSSAFLQGADADELNHVYETESKLLEPWTDSPGEIGTDDWRDYLGCREYGCFLVSLADWMLTRIDTNELLWIILKTSW